MSDLTDADYEDLKKMVIKSLQQSERRSQSAKAAWKRRMDNEGTKPTTGSTVSIRLRARNNLRSLNDVLNRRDLTDEAAPLFNERRELIRDLVTLLGEPHFDAARGSQVNQKLRENKLRLLELKKNGCLFKPK